MLLAAICTGEQKNWKCKKRGGGEYCHIYAGGMRELRRLRALEAPPTETETQDFWRSPGLRAALHTPA